MDFSKCIPPSQPEHLDSLLLRFIQEFEDKFHVCCRINSAYRTVDWEHLYGRDGSSSHCLGKAVDIHCPNNVFRYQLVKFALQFGINRIGIYKTFIHIDVATSKDNKTPCIIWHA